MKEGKLEKNKEKIRSKEEIRTEIKNLVETERSSKKKNEPYNARLVMVDPDTLADSDLAIYEKYKNNAWGLGDFLTYTDQVTEELRKIDEQQTKKSNKTIEASNSRDNFRGWIAERAMLKFPGEESAEETSKI